MDTKFDPLHIVIRDGDSRVVLVSQTPIHTITDMEIVFVDGSYYELETENIRSANGSVRTVQETDEGYLDAPPIGYGKMFFVIAKSQLTNFASVFLLLHRFLRTSYWVCTSSSVTSCTVPGASTRKTVLPSV